MQKRWIAVGAAAVALGAAGAGVMWWSQQHAQTVAARRQITEFSEAWHVTRTCLFGMTPLAADRAAALTLRQITDPRGRRALIPCAQLATSLKRPKGDSSGVDAIEADWTKLRKTSAQVAIAINWLTSDAPNKEPAALRADAVEAIAAFEHDLDELRKAAGMPPDEREGTPNADLPVLGEGTVVTMGGDPIVPSEVSVVGDLVVIHGQTGGGPAFAALAGAKQITAFYVGDKATHAGPPAATWGAWFVTPDKGPGTIRAAELDAAGEPKDDGAVVSAHAPAKPVAGADGTMMDEGLDISLVGAIGAAADRGVAWTDHGEPHLAVSHDSGKTWTEVKLPTGPDGEFGELDGKHAAELGRFDYTVHASDVDRVWIPFDAAHLEPPATPLRIPTELVEGPCVAPNTVWWNTMDGVVRVNGGAVEKVSRDGFEGRDPVCDDTRLAGVLRSDGGMELIQACASGAGCASQIAVPQSYAAELRVGVGAKQGVFAVQQLDGFLIRWRKGDNGSVATALARTSDGDDLQAVVEWDGALYAVLVNHERAHVVALPVK